MMTKNRLCILIFVCLLFACEDEDALKPNAFNDGVQINMRCPEALPNTGDDVCGLYEVPLNWLAEDRTKINVFLRAFLSKQSNVANGISKGQLWLIDGGPGASGATFSDPAFVKLVHDFGWDLYLPSHRGVGFSSHLHCSLSHQAMDEQYVNVCSDEINEKYGMDVNWFSAVGAAYDLNYLIEHNNPNDLPVVVMGTSYGSFLTQRFIQLFESTIDAAILLSGTNLRPAFENVSMHEEETFKRLLELCDLQVDCRNMFDNNTELSAYEAARSLVLENGWQQCAISDAGAHTVSHLLRSLASSSRFREQLPLAIKRLSRCDANDIEALRSLQQSLRIEQQRQQAQLFQFNPLMTHHQIFTELLSPEVDIPMPFNLPTDSLLGNSVKPYVDNRHAWLSRSSPIELPSTLSSTLPILAIHGGLDMQASVTWFEDLSAQLRHENQTAVLFPYAGHGTPNYTNIEDETNTEVAENCTWLIINRFLQNVSGKVDIGCVGRVKKFSFDTE